MPLTNPKLAKAACPRCGHAAHVESCRVVVSPADIGLECGCKPPKQEEAAEPRADGWYPVRSGKYWTVMCSEDNAWPDNQSDRDPVEIGPRILMPDEAPDNVCPISPQELRDAMMLLDTLITWDKLTRQEKVAVSVLSMHLGQTAAWLERGRT